MSKISITTLVFSLFVLNAMGQTPSERERIVSFYDLHRLDSLRLAFESNFLRQKAEAIDYALQRGIPEKYVDEKGNYNELMYIEDGNPIYYQTHNAGSAITARVNRVNTGGVAGLNLNGQNMILGIWDGGPVRHTHQDLVGRVTVMDLETFLTSTSGTSHATHVAGTMLGSGVGNASAKGLAYQANLWGNTFANDQSEVVNQASLGLLVSNHSYGIPVANVSENVRGAYNSEARSWDLIMNNAPYLQPVISAGNDRGTAEDTKGGRDLLVGNKNSKNSIVVAAVHNVANYTSPTSVTMSSFSSWGPTDDFRIKPDIAAKGVSVFSLNSTADTDYYSSQGTSMAAPAVSGTLILMQQHHNELYAGYMRAATVKAVMINSADETGDHDGPDYKFGWGLINAQKGAALITNKGTAAIIDELTLTQGQTYTRNIVSNGNPMKITVVWNDPAGTISNGVLDDPTPVLVNDLDVRVTQGTNVHYPWVLNPFFIQGGAIQDDNAYDNVESIDIPNPSGQYTITITHKGTLAGGSQNYSLVVSGVDETLSVGDSEFKNFAVYPNPSSGQLNFSFEENSSDEIVIVFYDLQGRMVRNFNFSSGATDFTQTINVSDLSKGLYLVKVTQDTKVRTQKVLIQ